MKKLFLLSVLLVSSYAVFAPPPPLGGVISSSGGSGLSSNQIVQIGTNLFIRNLDGRGTNTSFYSTADNASSLRSWRGWINAFATQPGDQVNSKTSTNIFIGVARVAPNTAFPTVAGPGIHLPDRGFIGNGYGGYILLSSELHIGNPVMQVTATCDMAWETGATVANVPGGLQIGNTSGHSSLYVQSDGYSGHSHPFTFRGTGEGGTTNNNVGIMGITNGVMRFYYNAPIWNTVSSTAPEGDNNAQNFSVFEMNQTGITMLNSKDVFTTDEAYGAGWNGDLTVPTKNAVYDKIETISGGLWVLGDDTSPEGTDIIIPANGVDWIGNSLGSPDLKFSAAQTMAFYDDNTLRIIMGGGAYTNSNPTVVHDGGTVIFAGKTGSGTAMATLSATGELGRSSGASVIDNVVITTTAVSVDFTTAGDTALLTVSSGRHFIVLSAQIRLTDVDTIMGDGDVKIKCTQGDIIATAALGSPVAQDFIKLNPATPSKIALSDSLIEIEVVTPESGTQLTGLVELTGYYVAEP